VTARGFIPKTSTRNGGGFFLASLLWRPQLATRNRSTPKALFQEPPPETVGVFLGRELLWRPLVAGCNRSPPGALFQEGLPIRGGLRLCCARRCCSILRRE